MCPDSSSCREATCKIFSHIRETHMACALSIFIWGTNGRTDNGQKDGQKDGWTHMKKKKKRTYWSNATPTQKETHNMPYIMPLGQYNYESRQIKKATKIRDKQNITLLASHIIRSS